VLRHPNDQVLHVLAECRDAARSLAETLCGALPLANPVVDHAIAELDRSRDDVIDALGTFASRFIRWPRRRAE
jgi:hypothetical protein